jgi:hypothetical protein
MYPTDHLFDAELANKIIPFLIANCQFANKEREPNLPCPADCPVKDYCNLKETTNGN